MGFEKVKPSVGLYNTGDDCTSRMSAEGGDALPEVFDQTDAVVVVTGACV